MRKILLICMMLSALFLSAQQKREFRGAWIQCVNGQFKGIGTETMQRTLTYQLNELQKDGCNAIIFQVRPECDALYESKLEPWSYYLTGRQGEKPTPYWDPLQWMINECHRRGMELHAWINPYRAKTKSPHENAVNHVIVRHPEWTFEYDGLTLLNPAYEACRNYICDVVKDIVERYDVDGLHIDDYFYPYPVAGVEIPDMEQYRAAPNGMKNRDDWRRYNVNLFIQQGLRNRPQDQAMGQVWRVALRHLSQSEKRPQRQPNQWLAELRPTLCRCPAMGCQWLDGLVRATIVLGDRQQGCRLR